MSGSPSPKKPFKVKTPRERLTPDQLARLEKAEKDIAPKRYQATLDAYGKALLDNKIQIEALQKNYDARQAGEVPPTKKTNETLLSELGDLEAQLRDLNDSIEQIMPEITHLEEQRARQERMARTRSRTSSIRYVRK
jgi:predicted nuclease with TOPRIM domain